MIEVNRVDPFSESSKQRALRLPLSSVRDWDRILSGKLIVLIVVLLLSGLYAYRSTCGPSAPIAFSHGPVANVHATWDHACGACHENFPPLLPGTFLPPATSSVGTPPGGSSSEWPVHHRADEKCGTCHAPSRHNGHELLNEVGTCASCHMEHRGRNADLVRPGDEVCTRCHANIAGHRRNSAVSSLSPPLENVVQFHGTKPPDEQAPHPDFRSLATDPGNIKFRHDMHMTEGIPVADPRGQGKRLVTLADLPPEFVERYRRPDQPRGVQDDREYPVRLGCSSCHRLEASDVGSASSVQTKASSSGEYMLPVNFDHDCRACHHLDYEPAAGKELKHGLKPAEAREFLMGRYLHEADSGKLDERATRLVPRRPIPGQSPEPASRPMVPDNVAAQVAAAERYLRSANACAKCHLLKATDEAPSPSFGIPDVEPANIPAAWLQHARFDHAAHRAVQCAACHSLAMPSNNPNDRSVEPQDHRTVMIEGRKACVPCHSPSTADGASGGARFDCVECHRYHDAQATPLGTRFRTGR